MGSVTSGIKGMIDKAGLGGSPLGQAAGYIDKNVSGLFGGLGPKVGDDGGIGQIKDAALGMYNEGAADYAAQKDNRAAFATQLADRALGKAPSIADAQMRQAQDRSLSQQLAIANSNKSVNPALAFRTTQRLGADAGMQVSQAAGIAKVQEQQQNQKAYQDFITGIQTQRNNSLAAGTGAAQALATKNASDADSQNKFMGNLIGGVAAAAPTLAMMSDKNVKKNVKDANPKSFLDALSAKSYEYKDSKHGKGQQMSVMAQDLEKAGPAGKAMVVETPEGKAVDYGKGFSAILAAQVDLNERLKEIEAKYGKKK